MGLLRDHAATGTTSARKESEGSEKDAIAEAVDAIQVLASPQWQEITKRGAERHPQTEPARVLAAIDDLVAQCRRFREANVGLVRENRQLTERNTALLIELGEVRKARNATVTVTLGQAIRGKARDEKGTDRLRWRNARPEAFEAYYRDGRSEMQFRFVGSTVWGFVDGLPKQGGTPLRDVDAKAIEAWLLRTANPRTRRTRRCALGVFFRWAVRTYGLHRNPVADLDAIRGVVQEEILAFRAFQDLRAFVESLRPWPYWQAWAAAAILYGPRWAEQARLTLDDVHLPEGYITIKARKTGRVRHVRIEKTILMPILTAHVERRQQERTGGATEGERSLFVFPSTLGPGIIERTKSDPGCWSGNRAWHSAWQPVRDAARKDAKSDGKPGTAEDAAWWDYTQAEWRHSFGTALAMCGFNDLEGSRMMGNSPTVFRNHYAAGVSPSPEERWPLRYS